MFTLYYDFEFFFYSRYNVKRIQFIDKNVKLGGRYEACEICHYVKYARYVIWHHIISKKTR